MATVTREETKFIQKVIILMILPLIAYGFVKLRWSGKSESVQEKIGTIEQRVSRYIRRKGAMPTLRRVAQLEEKQKALDEKFDSVASFSAVPPIDPPDEVIEKGVYFKKQLYMAQKGLEKRAKNKEISIPETLGFAEALPPDRDVPVLLRKLETIDKIITIMIGNNVDAINVIKLLEDQRFLDDDGVEMPMTEIAIRIDSNCTKESLTRVLHAIGALKPFIFVKDINAKKLKENILETSFVFSRLVLAEK